MTGPTPAIVPSTATATQSAVGPRHSPSTKAGSSVAPGGTAPEAVYRLVISGGVAARSTCCGSTSVPTRAPYGPRRRSASGSSAGAPAAGPSAPRTRAKFSSRSTVATPSTPSISLPDQSTVRADRSCGSPRSETPSTDQGRSAPTTSATVGTMSRVSASRSSTTPARWPGYFTNSGTHRTSAALPSLTPRSDCSSVKLMPWSAVTTTRASSHHDSACSRSRASPSRRSAYWSWRR